MADDLVKLIIIIIVIALILNATGNIDLSQIFATIEPTSLVESGGSPIDIGGGSLV